MKTIISLLLFSVILGACGQKNDDKKDIPKIETSEGGKASVPDVGKVELVSVTATGVGETASAAVNEALKSAIVQVNGVSMSSTSMQTRFGLSVDQSSSASAEGSVSGAAEASLTTNRGNESAKATYSESAKGSSSSKSVDTVRGQAFAEQIVAASKGHIAEFKVIASDGPDAKGSFSVKIEAKLAKFKGPADSGRIKIVIAPLKSSKPNFNFAGEQVASSEVGKNLRQRIIDALSQTGRFTILDREFGAEVDGELAMIASGQQTDLAKLGQTLNADLIWVGVINDFSYDKRVRKLETSDRELVSFTGGWSISQRLINVATKQILLSTTIDGNAPSIAPTTLGASVDKGSTLKTMESDIIKQATEAILLRTFPISVVEIDGTAVVLSQGGKSMSPQSRYKVYSLGKELKDPQTGQLLGRMEKYCCDVVIDRVTPAMSYGQLENVKISLDGIKADSLQVREAVAAKEKTTSENKDVSEKTQSARKPTDARRPSAGTTSNAEPEKSIVKEKDW